MDSIVNRAEGTTVRLLAACAFLFVMVFNVNIGPTSDGASDGDLLGLSLSVFVPSSEATGGYCKLTYMMCGDVVVAYCWDVPTTGQNCLPCGPGC
jgi:hypothetical protein